MWDILLVGAGGFLGAQARYGVSNFAARKFGTAFPYGTYLINLSGSLVLGLFLGLVSRAILAEESYRWLVAVGFCGGYTTFSTFSLESWQLLAGGKFAYAAAYILGSVILSIIGFGAGLWILR